MKTKQKTTSCGICNKEIVGAQYKIVVEKEKMWACEDCYLEQEDC